MSENTDHNDNGREREYIVLRLDADVPEELGTFTAANADQACRKAVDPVRFEINTLEHGVRLVAVPVRYWHPRTYRNKTETRIVAS